MKIVDELVMVQDRITKNTVRFRDTVAEDSTDEAPITTLYVRKGAFADLGKLPERIVVTVTAE